MQALVIIDLDRRGVMALTMNRPERHNAFNDELVAALDTALAKADTDSDVRLVVLAGAGKSFSAGADLDAMRAAGAAGRDDNIDAAMRWAAMLRRLASLSKPTIAVVQGAAIAGGVGLASACDVVLAEKGSQFGISEVRLGIMPAIISPYVLAAIGARNARRYFLTGERFDAEAAHQMGLVHQLCDDTAGMAAAAETVIDAFLLSAPTAIRHTKAVAQEFAASLPDEARLRDLAGRLADRRASPEGQEGLAAFFEKRLPSWAG